MIRKETFVKIMNDLEAMDRKMDKVDEALRELSPDFGGFYLPQATSIAIDVLQEVFDDKENNWLCWFAYEKDWLKDYKTGDIEINGEPLEIQNWESVYDFLTENMRQNRGTGLAD